MSSVDTVVVPQPKMTPKEHYLLYLPKASNETYGVVKFVGKYFVITNGAVELKADAFMDTLIELLTSDNEYVTVVEGKISLKMDAIKSYVIGDIAEDLDRLNTAVEELKVLAEEVKANSERVENIANNIEGDTIDTIEVLSDYRLRITFKNGDYVETESLKGGKGDTGERGRDFYIKKSYNSIASMQSDYYNSDVEVGELVIITSNVEDPDNAKLYRKGESGFEYITDMSGATGIQGPEGVTPRLRISNDVWEVSYTNGVSWNSLGVNATGPRGYTPAVKIGDDGYWYISPHGDSQWENTWIQAQGPKGDAFEYSDFTADQLEALRGPQGDPYVLTDADMEAIATAVYAKIPDAESLLL